MPACLPAAKDAHNTATDTVGKTGKAVLLAILLMTSGSTLWADDYLDAIKAEAEGLTVDPKTAIEEGSASVITVDKNVLSRDDFDAMLDKDYHGTFLFYSRLSSSQQEQVYRSYMEDRDISRIRKMIADLIVSN
jgi:hypothetical protein